MNNMMSVLLFGGLAFIGWQMLTRTRNQALVEAPQAAQQRPDNPPANLFWRGNNQLPEDVDVDIGI
tara:strand:+ start:8513 stop:8710 length:198 start_codon:yes stop_codon:yes gene_type:complete